MRVDVFSKMSISELVEADLEAGKKLDMIPKYGRWGISIQPEYHATAAMLLSKRREIRAELDRRYEAKRISDTNWLHA